MHAQWGESLHQRHVDGLILHHTYVAWCGRIKNSMGHGSASDGDFAEARALISPDMMYAPEKGTYTSAAAASNSDRVSSLQVTLTAA